jgi:NADH dehydrogenase (ubiquinone) 1 alpha subcomplex subunit 13
MSYGWYHLWYGQREKFELSREKAWARVFLLPVLQAETDRDQVRRWYADQAREKHYLGRETSPYNTDRLVISL